MSQLPTAEEVQGNCLQRPRSAIMMIAALLCAFLMAHSCSTVPELPGDPAAGCPCSNWALSLQNCSNWAILNQPPLMSSFGRVGAFEGQGPVGVHEPCYVGEVSTYRVIGVSLSYGTDDEDNTTEGQQSANNQSIYEDNTTEDKVSKHTFNNSSVHEQAEGGKHSVGEVSTYCVRDVPFSYMDSDEDNTTEGQQSTTNPSVHEDVSTEGEVSKHNSNERKLLNASSNASKAAQQGNAHT